MPKNTTVDFSLVLPCYNESSHIKKSINTIINTLEDTKYKYEVILYDDKSADNTAELISNIAQTFPNIKCFYHLRNIGRGGTVRDGILKAKGDIVGFIDIDLEVSPDYIPHFVRLIQTNEADIVVADRKYPMVLFPINTFVRTILSEVYAFFIRRLLKLPIHDTEAGYKFFNKQRIMTVLSEIEDEHWFWDTEVIARGLYHGLIIKEAPVLFLRNPNKQSTVRLIPDIIAYIKAIRHFRRSVLQKE